MRQPTPLDSTVRPLSRRAGSGPESGLAVASPPLLQAMPPQWVADALLDGHASSRGTNVRTIDAGSLLLLGITIEDAGSMDVDALRAAVTAAYVSLGEELRAAGMTAIRLWNYLPDPGRIMAPGLDRYMVFNAGRHDGYRCWFDGAERFGSSLPTASAVGITGSELVIHCLASIAAGEAVENPRQRPAWRYSPRYGPMPPSFSRATIATVRGRRLLLIAGTASIVGEDSMHVGNAAAQLDETLENLGTVVSTAWRRSVPPGDALRGITEMRVYLTREEHAPIVEGVLRERCPTAARIEMAIAHLCRPELLVEIEAIAAM